MGDAALTSRTPHDLAGWVRALENLDIPVLASTGAAIEDLRPLEDTVDAHLLAPILADDPLATLRLLRHVARLRPNHDGGEAETVTEALVMLGIPPFFRAFPPDMPLVADQGHDAAGPPTGLAAVLRRAHRAARLALCFAAHRQDQDAVVIAQAALLHDFAEILLWLQAPDLASKIADALSASPGLRTHLAQRQWIGVTTTEVQQALMARWKLPALLIEITDDHDAPSARVRNVQLAIRLARHSANGWDDPALPDDFQDLARLLQLTAEHAKALVEDTERDD